MDWKNKHRKVIEDFLKYLNKNSDDYILKGGTALMLLYKLNRFSEDIDLDGTHKSNIKKLIEKYCKENNYSFRIAKDTENVIRYMIYYETIERPLKIETSLRKKTILEKDIIDINNIKTYTINALCNLKLMAYNNRNKIRDLYDLVFIINNYWYRLSDETKDFLNIAFTYKGIEYFDYIIENQKDELIDKEIFIEEFLKSMDTLDLLDTKHCIRF